MTGFSKAEVKENGIIVNCEIKTLNGRYLELNCRMPKFLSSKEMEVRELAKNMIERGTVSIFVQVDTDEAEKQFELNDELAEKVFTYLNDLRGKLKIRETVKMDHILHFSQFFQQKEDDDKTEEQWKMLRKALRDALRDLDKMRKQEGQQIQKDITERVKGIKQRVEKIERLGIDRIPVERERLRQRIAQLFESDEIDEQRLRMEMVLMADKLDISEECVRLNSHIKYFFETVKAKESSGKKLNFLLQEMHREINTIGSKANDHQISMYVIEVKEELERIREQVQNIE